ncbi:MAG: V-type ATP synthase subunit A [bacterium]|nr:V-type ATP synthase subunit A [bacterium]
MIKGQIVKIAGPLVVAENMAGVSMYNVVKVSKFGLVGEVIELKQDKVSIQVYEETIGIGRGEPVEDTGVPLSIELGPGLLESIFDGIQRPLDVIKQKTGNYITRGVSVPALNRDKKWAFEPLAKKGDKVSPGDKLGVVQETVLIKHYIMVPNDIEGELIELAVKGNYTITELIAKIKTTEGVQEITMLRKWPVRKMRPYIEKMAPKELLSSGQRVIDTFFPVTKGGTACIPGPFGSGKTVVQQQLAKWADADVVIYIGCGERGNEITDVLLEFPELKDPKSGEPLMKRTVLVANTSNMPVAAREASIYTGVTMAEYYRDMGYNVALMADSTSRWAEALREISGRMEEMPGEEGYPAYLASRIAGFYERAGQVVCLASKEKRIGSISIIGAVSPPGGDLSDPVVQATLRIVKVFWGLEDKLAYRRHFPAINWLRSYSLYLENIEEYLKTVAPEISSLRSKSMRILQEEAELEEIVRLVGVDALSDHDKLTMETAKSIREDFLHQNAFDMQDTYTSLKKQYNMLKLIISFHERSLKCLENKISTKEIFNLPVRDKIAKSKFIPEDQMIAFDYLENEMSQVFEKLFAHHTEKK